MSGGVSFGLTPPGLNMMYISQAGQFDIPQRKIMYSNPNVVFFLFLFFFFSFYILPYSGKLLRGKIYTCHNTMYVPLKRYVSNTQM